MEQTFFVYKTPLANTPLASITIASNGEAITGVAFGAKEFPGKNKPSKLTNDAANEIQEYLAGKRRNFTVSVAPEGTPFQQEVWEALTHVPFGQTVTYGELAEMVGRPTAARAVGGANNKNPIPLIIPCHRVIGANGNLVGYAYGLRLKQFLLDLERRYADTAPYKG